MQGEASDDEADRHLDVREVFLAVPTEVLHKGPRLGDVGPRREPEDVTVEGVVYGKLKVAVGVIERARAGRAVVQVVDVDRGRLRWMKGK